MQKSNVSPTESCGFDTEKFVIFLLDRFPKAPRAKMIARALSVPGVLEISHRTVESWLARKSRPDFHAVGRMIELWEADFIFAVMARPSQWARNAKVARQFLELERQRSELALKLGLTTDDV